MSLDYSKLSDIKVAGVNMDDYPDFVDAFIESATYDGRDITEEELEVLNEDSAFVYDQVMERIY